MRRILPVLSAAATLAGCPADAPKRNDSAAAQFALSALPSPAHPSKARLLERSGSGRVAYLGWDAKPAAPATAGSVVELTHYFQVQAPFRGHYDVFVHGEQIGSSERVLVADHPPMEGKVPTNTWKKGEIFADRHRILVPVGAQAPALELFVGLFSGDQRLTVEAPPSGSDGQDRVRAGRLPIGGETIEDGLPSVTIPRAAGPITADGVIDEAAWSQAVVLDFTDTLGRPIEIRFATKLRLLWDDANLYVAFEARDQDISCPFSKRDDPIYDHEAVELFIMPNVVAPGLGPYVELQASPKGVIFDAAFVARRTGMDKGFNGGQTVGTKLDGTLNVDDGTDKGWVSEWVVPWTSLRGVSEPPSVGDEWRMNAFRIEKYRAGGQVAGEYTAWSPPQVGDFHNVARFGRMKFGG